MSQNEKNTPLNNDTTKIILDSISDGVFTIDLQLENNPF